MADPEFRIRASVPSVELSQETFDEGEEPDFTHQLELVPYLDTNILLLIDTKMVMVDADELIRAVHAVSYGCDQTRLGRRR